MKTTTIVFCSIIKSKEIIEFLQEKEKDKYSYSIFENRVEIETSPISKFVRSDTSTIFSGLDYLEFSWMDFDTFLFMRDELNNVNLSGRFSFDNFYNISKTLMFTSEFSENLLNLKNPSCSIASEQFMSDKEKLRNDFFDNLPNKVSLDEEW
jgi:hypothetical protein